MKNRMKALLEPLASMAGFSEMREFAAKPQGMLEISGCIESQKANLASGISEGRRAVLYVAENELKARQAYEDLRLYDRSTYRFPGRDLIFYQADVSGGQLTRQRMSAIKALISLSDAPLQSQESSDRDKEKQEENEQESVTIVTFAGGCMERLLPLRVLKNKLIHITDDQELDLKVFSKKLTELGYTREAMVEAPGQFSVRGDIIDVFSVTEEVPWRIELFGDEIDSIRSFETDSQRSIERQKEITIYPAGEEPGMDPEDPSRFRHMTDTILDYLPGDSVIFLDEPARILESARALSDEYQEAMKHRIEAGTSAPEEAARMLTETELMARFQIKGCIGMSLMPLRRSDFDIARELGVEARSVNSYNNQFDTLVKDLGKWKKKGYKVILLSASGTRGERLVHELGEEGLSAFYSENPDRILQQREIMVTRGNAARGFEYPMLGFAVVTESDIFGVEKTRRRFKRKVPNELKIHDFSELSVGDYVVHEDHGLGIYRGIEKIETDHVVKDYIRIEYAKGANLYVAATQLDVLQKYSGGSTAKEHPKVSQLGGKEWGRQKSRARSAVKDIAKQLVSLYAARMDAKGFQFSKDTEWQKEFEEMFPFEETEDQLQAIEDTKRDMESDKAMDRLICGDVGYGKTEIAIRAAFKAVMDHKQVAVLVPTTILAQQHYNTFTQRMENFAVNIGLLSRFRTSAQQKKTLEELRDGRLDIVIGTHRLLSKDVKFSNLGLLVVDEEQRFGVTHKEKIKELKKNVDVLTLTATPIPRTLHMSLIGIRDMSTLEEPPMDRTPIQTYVLEYNEEIVREAISRELARGGQVYYVYNRVNTIADVAGRLQKLLPEASIAYADGQMKASELETIMYSFVNREIDVLVSTTIIETGMDISNANTMIIQDADRMGLAQLYQLRGRIGRSNRTAYAFLMYKRDKVLKEVAEKRLHAIREYTEFGSGVKVAMRDLEIRGAGNLLGAEQSGHMEEIGYDLYCKMLAEAVREEKGETPEEAFETSIDIGVSAFIPPAYIPDETQKLQIYQRIAAIRNKEEADDIMEELIDRFGDPPRSVTNLIAIAEIKAIAHRAYVTAIKQIGDAVRIELYPRARLDVQRIPELLSRYGRTLSFQMTDPPFFRLSLKEVKTNPDKIMNILHAFMDELADLAETEKKS
ncbi:MAG: transcription-repair coupling factor [Eubacterium sp.]|nr:transcription-repair coupling factor [Eubacterium sp.]